MKWLASIFFIVLFSAIGYGQTDCAVTPQNCVLVSREVAIKALKDSDRVVALESEVKVKDGAFADLRKELNDMRIEFARVSGENTGLKQNAVSDRAIIELLLKNTKKKCLPFSVCLF